MTRNRSPLSTLLLLVTLLAACGPAGPQPTPPSSPVAQPPTSPPPTSPPRVALPYTPVPASQLAPVIVQRSPEPGQELRPDGAIELVFDRPMDRASVAGALTVGPNVAGALEWPDDRTLRFKPDAPLQRAAAYDVTLGPDARTLDGARLGAPFQFRFPTAGFLEVGQVIPADGASDMQIDSAITVLFNRPVVPLTTVAQQASLPQPLSFEPAVQGQGEWLGTAVYVFRPATALAGGTTYTARVAAGLTDAAGNPLQGEYTWRFTTARPQVLSVSPADGERGVPLERPVVLNFNQPLDPASAQAAFSLQGDDGTTVAGRFQVFSSTLIFTPDQRLAFDRGYTVAVGTGLTGRGGGAGMAGDFRSTFRTVPLPRLVRTEPADGEQNAPVYNGFTLYFNAPIDPTTVLPNLQLTPPFSITQVYTSYQVLPGDPTVGSSFSLWFTSRPSTDYEARIGPAIADPYGNTIGDLGDPPQVVRYRTGPLPPQLSLVTPGTIATYSAANPARLGLLATNVDTARLALYRIGLDDLKQWPNWLYSGQPIPNGAQELRRWEEVLNPSLDQAELRVIDLVAGGGRLDPGVYLLQLDQTGGQPQSHILVVSTLNLTLKAGVRDALVWATDLQSGQPVPNLALELFDEQGTSLGTATTDSSGVATASLNRSENRGLLAISRQPLAAVAASWSGGISPWDFNLPADFGFRTSFAYIYTDRPIYRPGQPVHFKGVVRNEDDARFSLVSTGTISVSITSPSGETVSRQDLQLSQNGTFDGNVTLPEGAALGPYAITTTWGSGFAGQFQVVAYRPPEFEVTVTPQATEIISGTAPRATVDARYFFGGPVAGAPVQWNVAATSYRFAPAGFERYRFGDNDSPFVCWECWWFPPPSPTIIRSGTGTTDPQGKVQIELPADQRDWRVPVPNQAPGPQFPVPTPQTPAGGSVQLTIEATATGRDNQAISGRSEVVVHSADVYVGLAARSSLGKAGEAQTIDLVATDTGGRRRSGQTIDVEIFKITWENRFIQDGANTGRWETTEKRELAATQTATTDARGEAAVAFTPTAGGSYRVAARARDGSGRVARASLFVWVSDDTYVSWRRDNTDRITLIADRTSYKPGETADILIPSPFQTPHLALITVERGKVLSHEVRPVAGNSLVYQLPLTADHVPNVYVSVVLVSPPEAPGRPADYRVGVLPLTVAPGPQSLKITLTPQTGGASQAAPGAQVRYDAQVTSLNGQPVAAELSLDLVDKAVLSLAPRLENAIGDAFYSRRNLGITTASGLTLSAERFLRQFDTQLQQKLQSMPGGGGLGGGAPAAAQPAAPAATASPAAGQAPPERAGDRGVPGGMAGSGPAPVVREQFADTAYWNPVVTTDAAGRASIQLTLPDNLTTWVMRGVGLTADTRVGEGTVELVATKPLLVRPVTPRFLVAGDTVELAANLSNNTGAALEARVSLAAPELQLTGSPTQTVQVPAGGEASVRWQATVPDVESAELVFTAISGQYSDASRPRLATAPGGRLPVYRFSVPEVVGTGGQLEGAGARTEVIALPPRLDTRRGELSVRIDPSLAAGLRDGLRALENPEYPSTEALVSSFLPNLATLQALKRLGIADPALEANLPKLIEDALNRLQTAQHPDGGWGWWPPVSGDPQSNPHVSAYVVLGLLRAREAGYTVRDDVFNNGLSYLATQLKPADTRPSGYDTVSANQQAWLLYVLGEAGKPDGARLDNLYQARDQLGVYGRAFLVLALNRAGGDAARIKTLLSDLNNAAVLSATGAHWEESRYDWWSMSTGTRSTAIVLLALTKLDPQNQLTPNVVRWLMVARTLGVWGTSQETAWSILALTEWMQLTGELKASYDYGAWVNDRQLAGGFVGPADVQRSIVLLVPFEGSGPVSVLPNLARGLTATTILTTDYRLPVTQSNRLTIGRGPGDGRLYYTAHLRAFLPVETITALDRGFDIQRRYVAVICDKGRDCPELTDVRLGDEVRVELSITTAADRYYVRIEDPLPAGAEAVDPNLATTAQLGSPPVPGDVGPLPIDGGARVSILGGPWWWWRWYSRSELRDEKVVLFADYLPRGSYLFSYTIRATTPGEFRVIPTTGSEHYFPEVYGRASGRLLRVSR